jgi:hypothetical protein
MRARAPSFYTTFFPPFIQFKEMWRHPGSDDA